MNLLRDPSANDNRPHREPALPWLDGADPLGGLIAVALSAAAVAAPAGFFAGLLAAALWW